MFDLEPADPTGARRPRARLAYRGLTRPFVNHFTYDTYRRSWQRACGPNRGFRSWPWLEVPVAVDASAVGRRAEAAKIGHDPRRRSFAGRELKRDPPVGSISQAESRNADHSDNGSRLGVVVRICGSADRPQGHDNWTLGTRRKRSIAATRLDRTAGHEIGGRAAGKPARSKPPGNAGSAGRINQGGDRAT